MKKLFSMLILLTVVLTLSAQEQKKEIMKREGMMKANPAQLAPNFTAEQQKQMAEFKLNLQKEMLQIDNQLNEKKAQLKTLEQAEKPNMKSVYAKIDEISNLQNQKMKAMSTHKNNVRFILTDEQRVKFDMMNQGQGHRGNQPKCCMMEKGRKMNMQREGKMMHKEGMQMHKEGMQMNKEGMQMRRGGEMMHKDSTKMHKMMNVKEVKN